MFLLLVLLELLSSLLILQTRLSGYFFVRFKTPASCGVLLCLTMEHAKYKELLVVPDVIDAPPETTCDVVFPSGAKAILGNELQPEDVREAPRIEYPAEDGVYYSVVIADADTQNPDKNEGICQWQQWVVVNVPGKDISKGQVLSEYMGSGPLPGTGLHRYVTLVFKQKSKVEPKEPYFGENDGDRKDFSVRHFIKKYGLEQPLAGNFYQCKYDKSVDSLYNENNASEAQK